MPTFDIDLVRISTAIKTLSVQAEDRLQAQEKALDDAGNYLYKECDALYELDENNPDNEDQFSAISTTSLVLGTSCKNLMASIPAYVQMPVTANFVRKVKTTRGVCAANGFSAVTIQSPENIRWAPVNDDDSVSLRAHLPMHTAVTVTRDDFFLHSADLDGVNTVESIKVTFDELQAHIESDREESVLCNGTDEKIDELLELLAQERGELESQATADKGDRPVS